ncbi:MAG: hypothetical protein KDD92_01590 [Caldilineaceae bacterium]|nr:hypothetical protein [Caldilineaceae bacterium]
MRIWLIGCDDAAGRAIVQLAKNPNIELTVTSAQAHPKAVAQGLIEEVDQVVRVSHININDLARRIRPDLILIDPGEFARDFARISAGITLSEELTREIAATSDYPCLIL